MRRGVGVLVLGLAVCVPAASPTSTAGWKNLKYFDYESQQLVVATDAAWKGGKVVRALPAQQPLDISGPGLRRTKPQWLWAATCGSASQFVSFTREVRAPGDPKEGSLYFNLGFGRDLPFKSGDFLVNGTEVARIVVPKGRFSGFPKYFSGPLPAKALKAFVHGPNTLTIRVQRGSLPKGQRCNSPNRLVGVVATLSLRFTPDVVAVPSTLGLAQVATTFGPYTGQMIFRNRGPSGSAGGKFVFEWSSQYVEPVIGTASISGGVTNCRSKSDGQSYGTIECEYEDLPVGKTLTVGFRGVARPVANWGPRSTGDLSHSWQILPAGGDVNAANNHGSHNVLFCGAQATDSRCKK